MTRPQGCPADELLVTEPGAELRAHLDSCARCRARLAQLRAFMAAEAAPGARVAEADARLATALDEAIFGGAPAVTAAPVRRVSEPSKRSIWETLFAPALRPAWALAVVVLVAAGSFASWQALKPQDAEVRGGAVGASTLEVLEPAPSEGAVTLSWRTVEGATRYDIVFLGDDLSELGAPVKVDEPTLTLRAGALPAGLRGGDSVLWIVIAREGELELSHSVATRVTLP